MSRDFEAMVVRTGTNFEWLYTETDRDEPGPNDNESPNAARILMFSAATDRYDGDVEGRNDKGGDVTGLSYKLLYKDPITDAYDDRFSVFALYRKLVNPDETFEFLLEHDPVAPKDLDTKFRRYDAELGDSNNFVCENIFEVSVTEFAKGFSTRGFTSARFNFWQWRDVTTGHRLRSRARSHCFTMFFVISSNQLTVNFCGLVKL